MKKIAILGHQEVSKVLAESFCDQGVPVTIISLCSKKAGNIKEYVNLESYCEKKSLNLHRISDYSLNSQECTAYFYQNSFDVVFVVGWSRLIPEAVLNVPNTKFIGWHGGPYAPPRCRGRAVVNWAILNNETDFFVYTMLLKPGIDDGDIIDVESMPISVNETAQSLYIKCALKLCEIMSLYLANDFVFNAMEQSDKLATYLPKRSPSDGEVDWKLPARVIERLVRALSFPFPPAWSILNGETVLIKRARALDYNCEKHFKNGFIYHATETHELVVCTGSGFLLVEEYECSGSCHVDRGGLFEASGSVINPTKLY